MTCADGAMLRANTACAVKCDESGAATGVRYRPQRGEFKCPAAGATATTNMICVEQVCGRCAFSYWQYPKSYSSSPKNSAIVQSRHISLAMQHAVTVKHKSPNPINPILLPTMMLTGVLQGPPLPFSRGASGVLWRLCGWTAVGRA